MTVIHNPEIVPRLQCFPKTDVGGLSLGVAMPGEHCWHLTSKARVGKHPTVNEAAPQSQVLFSWKYREYFIEKT